MSYFIAFVGSKLMGNESAINEVIHEPFNSREEAEKFLMEHIDAYSNVEGQAKALQEKMERLNKDQCPPFERIKEEVVGIIKSQFKIQEC